MQDSVSKGRTSPGDEVLIFTLQRSYGSFFKPWQHIKTIWAHMQKHFLREPVNLRKRKGEYKGVLDERKGRGEML